MQKYLSAFILILALVASSDAFAMPGPLQRYGSYGRVINAVALDAASTTFSIDMAPADQKGVWGLMTVWVCVTDASNSVTALTMTCSSSRDNGTTAYSMQDCTTASGVCTSSNASWTKNPSAITSPKCWAWRVDIEGLPYVSCTTTDTGGDASDLHTAYVTFATKG